MREIEGITSSGIVDVVARLVRQQPIVRRVVDAFERERRAEMISFGRVIVNNIEDDFDASVVKARHHLLELGKCEIRHMRVAPGRREEGNGIIAPIIGQPPVAQIAVVDESVDRQEFNRGHAETADMIEHLRLGQPAIGTAQDLGLPRDAAWCSRAHATRR